MKIMRTFSGVLISTTLLLTACSSTASTPKTQTPTVVSTIDRESKIPLSQHKITPVDDLYPPILHSNEYEVPVLMPYPISTAGAEDSGFIIPDGNMFYFWFTPDPNASLGQQIDCGVTGIYVAKKVNGLWQKPERVLLQDPDKQALDGAVFVQDNTLWFCSARTGYDGLHWFTANYQNGKWANWAIADFNLDYKVGELHISADGQELYFHSDRPGGKGQYDIWVSKKQNGEWQEPQNVAAVNSQESDGWPSLSPSGNELWFTRTYMGSPAIFRSKRIHGEWQEPELIISQFAGESSVDSEGNLYFTHHFYKNGVMLEADIYVAYKK